MNQIIKKISLTIVVAALACGTAMAQGLVRAPGRPTTGPMPGPDSVTVNGFGGNLEVNPCTGCNFDEADGGYYVWGSMNCEASGVTQWIAVPFISKRTGTTRSITASIELDNACTSLGTQVTLGIYNNDCTTGVGTVIATGNARVTSTGPCITTRTRVAANLTAGTRYWVAATTTAAQDSFSGIWYGSNQAQIGGNVASGGWFAFSGLVPGFSVD